MYTDLSLVDKYEMPDDEYAKRTGTVLEFKQRNRLGRFAETDGAKPPDEGSDPDAFSADADRITVGARCRVMPEAAATIEKRGVVAFVGKTKFKPGYWVGIIYDEPLGKNDGVVGGERYFTCPPLRGAFVRPNRVETGDFPEIDLLDEEL
ncbi:hypothetical protein HK405_002562 [Cladochytrium tenue]|nr:hypothetical protein HK405_002562 [Cladochytrium tenue]